MRRGELIAAAAAMAVFTLGSPVARSQDRSGPAQPPLWLPDAEYLRWPLPPSEQAYAGLSGRTLTTRRGTRAVVGSQPLSRRAASTQRPRVRRAAFIRWGLYSRIPLLR